MHRKAGHIGQEQRGQPPGHGRVGLTPGQQGQRRPDPLRQGKAQRGQADAPARAPQQAGVQHLAQAHGGTAQQEPMRAQAASRAAVSGAAPCSAQLAHHRGVANLAHFGIHHLTSRPAGLLAPRPSLGRKAEVRPARLRPAEQAGQQAAQAEHGQQHRRHQQAQGQQTQGQDGGRHHEHGPHHGIQHSSNSLQDPRPNGGVRPEFKHEPLRAPQVRGFKRSRAAARQQAFARGSGPSHRALQRRHRPEKPTPASTRQAQGPRKQTGRRSCPMPAYRLLYIEDNPVNALVVEELVSRRADIELRGAEDGQSGLALARDWRPHLVLLDMQLPDLDGFQVRQALAEHPDTAAIPCIALSANAMPEDIKSALAAGFADYWTKPIDFQAFQKGLAERLPHRG
ncbi:response regulator [Inhella sp. 1Y17]|uniref:Response regulator n=2 Tax=Inhella proteolytica TaxID=2795029 RepID=A0A931NJG1_9BURK|nr:response regulator [Inhella proteolytica]